MKTRLKTNLKVFHITPDYTRLTIWTALRAGQRTSVRTTRPTNGLSREARYSVLAAALEDEGLRAPAYIGNAVLRVNPTAPSLHNEYATFVALGTGVENERVVVS